ncbi:MAG: right-handed parallel beta-helix repeat-containing protein [Verrucomicrobiota bacterium]
MFTPPLLRISMLAVCLPGSALFAATYVVDQNHPAADDSGPGNAAAPFQTIAPAARLAGPGDVVEIYPGVYRERVAPAQGGEPGAPVTYRGTRHGAVVIKGSDEWSPGWSREPGGESVYRAPLDLALFEDWRPGRDPRLGVNPSPFHEEIIPSNGQDKLAKADKLVGTPLDVRARPVEQDALWRPVIGQIYADGRPLQQALGIDELRALPGSFAVDADGRSLLVHLPAPLTSPDEAAWEITTREHIFAPQLRGLGHIVLEDLVFEHAANQAPWPSVGAVSVRNGHDWIIRRCVIRHTQSVGLDIGGEWFDGTRLFGDAPDSSGHLVEDCVIHDHGLTGIYGYEVRDTVVRRNEIHGNNRLGFIQGFNARWEEYAGIKLLHARRVRVEDNFVHDNHAFGIWFDNQWQGSRISRNLVVDNQFGGVFIEFGEAPEAPLVIDHNIVLFTDEGSGIYCHDSSDIIVAHNLLYQNKDYGLWTWAVSNRGGKKGGARNLVATGNVFYGNGAGNIGFPAEGELSGGNRSNHNLFANKTWARSADTPTFSLHESYSQPGVSRADVARQLADRLAQAGGPDAALGFDHWRAQPSRALTFSQWQVATGNDRSSLVGSLDKALYRPGLRQLDFIPHAHWREVRVPPIPGVDRDYLGRPLAADGRIFPGPFALTEADLERLSPFTTFGRDQAGNLIRKENNLKGRQRLNLWPKPPVEQP